MAAMIAPNGAPVYYGRSLTYRTALLAPFWLAALEDVDPLGPGVTRGIASGVLRYFLEAGEGMHRPLSLGWRRPCPEAVQEYSGPGSPYFASMGFLGLLLPPDHKVWTDTEASRPTDATTDDAVLKGPHWIVSHRDGVVRLANHDRSRPAYWHPPQTRRDDPHYAKFGYSSHTAPAPHPDSVDAHFGLLGDDGRLTRRGPVSSSLTTGDIVASRHVPEIDGIPLDGVDITSATLIRGGFEVRCHLVCGAARRAVREGGYCVAHDTPPITGSRNRHAWVRADSGLNTSITGLYGWTAAETIELNAGNAMGRRCAVPVLTGHVNGTSSLHISLHMLGFSAQDGDIDAPSVHVTPDTGHISLTWAAGTSATTIDLLDLRNRLIEEAR